MTAYLAPAAVVAVFVLGLVRAVAFTEAMDTRKPIGERALANTVARICEAAMVAGVVTALLR